MTLCKPGGVSNDGAFVIAREAAKTGFEVIDNSAPDEDIVAPYDIAKEIHAVGDGEELPSFWVKPQCKLFG